MYQIGKAEKPKRHYGRYIFGVILLIVLAAGIFIYQDTKTNSKIIKQETALETSEVKNDAAVNVQKVDESTYTINLPQDYKLKARTQKPYQSATWQSTNKATNARSIQIYVDTIPTNLAINRLVPMLVNENHIVSGIVSDNCSTFVGPLRMTPELVRTAKVTPAKWQEVNFLCDLPNYLREVAGTGTGEGNNATTVTGPTKGKHRYFFVYTDHTAKPDFTFFTTILNSFEAK